MGRSDGGQYDFYAGASVAVDLSEQTQTWQEQRLAEGVNTPWGRADSVDEVAPGITWVATASHGGIKLSDQRQGQIPAPLRQEGGWYEEDCAAAIVGMTYPEAFSHWGKDDESVRAECTKSAQRWFGEELAAAQGGSSSGPDASALSRQKDFLIALGVECGAPDSGYTGEDLEPGGLRDEVIARMSRRLAGNPRCNLDSFDLAALTEDNLHAEVEAIGRAKKARAGRRFGLQALKLDDASVPSKDAPPLSYGEVGKNPWWNRAARLKAELATKAFAPQMRPDVAYGGARARTMTYSGAGLAVTMPSVAACRRMASDLEADPAIFDIPVQVASVRGTQVNAWVRVAKTADGRWGTLTLGGSSLPPSVNDKVSESVAAMLESRQPSAGLSEYTNILDRKLERQSAEGVDFTPVKSPAAKALGYDPETQTMFVVRHAYTRKSDGVTVPARTYAYAGIPPQAYQHLITAPARGSGIGRELNSVQALGWRVEVAECGDCGRTYAAEVIHRCRVVVPE